jgi:hypothetical protein
MPYAAPSTETADVMIKSFVDLKTEHQKLGKSKSTDRAHHEKLHRLAKDLDSKGQKVSGVLAKLIAQARTEHGKLLAVLDRLVEQALSVRKMAEAKSDRLATDAGHAQRYEIVKEVYGLAQTATRLKEQATKEHKACNEAVMVARTFEPEGLDESYRKPFVQGRSALFAEIKKAEIKLDKIAQLAELCDELYEKADEALTRRTTDEELAKDDVKVLAEKVGAWLADARIDAGRAIAKLKTIQDTAAARKIGAHDAATCRLLVHDCKAFLEKAIGNQELASKIRDKAERQYPSLARDERIELRNKLLEWADVIKHLKRTFEAGAKALMDIHQRARA